MKRLSVLASSAVVALAASGLIAPPASAQQNLVDTLSGATFGAASNACIAARIAATSSESVHEVAFDLSVSNGNFGNTGVWLVNDNSGSVGSTALGYFGSPGSGSTWNQGSPVAIAAGTTFWVVLKGDVPAGAGAPGVVANVTTDLSSNSGVWTYADFPAGGGTAYLKLGTCVTSGSTFTSFSSSSDLSRMIKLRLGGPGGGGSSSGSDATSQAPAPVMQQVGMPSAGCADYENADLNIGGAASGGWGQSWAQWVNGGEGGAVCTRTLVYSPTLGSWMVR